MESGRNRNGNRTGNTAKFAGRIPLVMVAVFLAVVGEADDRK